MFTEANLYLFGICAAMSIALAVIVYVNILNFRRKATPEEKAQLNADIQNW